MTAISTKGPISFKRQSQKTNSGGEGVTVHGPPDRQTDEQNPVPVKERERS